MIPRMFTRGTLVPFTRRSMGRTPPAPRDQGVRDVVARLEEAEREVARTIESLDEIAAMLRGQARPSAPIPAAAPQHPGLRRTVPPR